MKTGVIGPPRLEGRNPELEAVFKLCRELCRELRRIQHSPDRNRNLDRNRYERRAGPARRRATRRSRVGTPPRRPARPPRLEGRNPLRPRRRPRAWPPALLRMTLPRDRSRKTSAACQNGWGSTPPRAVLVRIPPRIVISKFVSILQWTLTPNPIPSASRRSCNRSQRFGKCRVPIARSEWCEASREELWLGTPQTLLNLFVFRVAAASPPQTARGETPSPLPQVYTGVWGQSSAETTHYSLLPIHCLTRDRQRLRQGLRQSPPCSHPNPSP